MTLPPCFSVLEKFIWAHGEHVVKLWGTFWDLSEPQESLSFLTSQMGLYKENLKFLSSYLAFL